MKIISAAFAFAITALASSAIASCGVERWAVKVASDQSAQRVADLPEQTTIGQLAKIPAPLDAATRKSSRYAPVELTVYEVTGQMILLKREAVGDYHIVLQDGKDHMIVKSPDPQCADGSRFSAEIIQVRQTINDSLGDRQEITARLTPNVFVTVTGVGFFDRLHGQEGVAPNGIELHPILSIEFHPEKTRSDLVNRVRRPTPETK